MDELSKLIEEFEKRIPGCHNTGGMRNTLAWLQRGDTKALAALRAVRDWCDELRSAINDAIRAGETNE